MYKWGLAIGSTPRKMMAFVVDLTVRLPNQEWARGGGGGGGGGAAMAVVASSNNDGSACVHSLRDEGAELVEMARVGGDTSRAVLHGVGECFGYGL
jgi:hypothetical protein